MALGRGAECGHCSIRAGRYPGQAPFADQSIGDDSNGVMGLAQAAGTGSFPPAEEDFFFQGSESFQAQDFLGGMNIHTFTGVLLDAYIHPHCLAPVRCWILLLGFIHLFLLLLLQ